MFPFASIIIEVATGIIFIFLLVSLICSQVNDKISSWLRMRAKGLEEGLYRYITGDKNFVEVLYQNPLISSVIPEDALMTQFLEKVPAVKNLIRAPKKPVNIEPGTFAKVLFDTLIPNNSGQTSVDQLRAAVETLPPAMPLRGPVLKIIATTENNIDTVRKNVEDWFDDAMAKTTNLYKAHMWRIALAMGAVIAVVLNVDTIGLFRVLLTDSPLRTALVAEANAYTQSNPDQQKALDKLNSLNLPIGWQTKVQLTKGVFCIAASDWYPRPQPGSQNEWTAPDACKLPSVPWYEFFLKPLGWLITAFAGAQGAPFWFDLLKKITNR